MTPGIIILARGKETRIKALLKSTPKILDPLKIKFFSVDYRLDKVMGIKETYQSVLQME